jgi:hypothetical protein
MSIPSPDPAKYPPVFIFCWARFVTCFPSPPGCPKATSCRSATRLPLRPSHRQTWRYQAQATEPPAKLVTKPSAASETTQPPPTPMGSQFGEGSAENRSASRCSR